MTQIAHRSSAVVTKRPDAEYTPARGDTRALNVAKSDAYPWRTDLAPDRTASGRHHTAAAETAPPPRTPINRLVVI